MDELSIDLTVWSSDLDFIVNDLPAPVKVDVIINTNHYDGSKAQLDQENVYEENGTDTQYMFTIYMNKDGILDADIPQEDKLINVDGVDYRVIRKSLDTAEQLYRVDLGQKYVG